ncbi:MAG: lyase family protein, partial [Polyangiales bacterium]
DDSVNAAMQFTLNGKKASIEFDQLVLNIKKNSAWTKFYFFMLIAAAFMAGYGLAFDNTVVVVASMLVSPLMGPILGVTFGLVLAGHHAELQRAAQRLKAAEQEVAVGKIAGAVGSYAHLDPAIEVRALRALGLTPETAATQIVARDRHAAWFSACAQVATGIERFATNVRHWQRSEVGEAEEAFGQGQKGSSAMPHKRNPVLSENLCGLARVVRAAVVPGLENVALWHERDISHSCVERMLLPDVSATLDFMLSRATKVVQELVVYPEAMQRNLTQSRGLWASEALLLALVDRGLGRQDAYKLVQRQAMRAFHGEGDFAQLVRADAEIGAHLDPSAVDQAFDLQHALRHVDAIIDRTLQASAGDAAQR